MVDFALADNVIIDNVNIANGTVTLRFDLQMQHAGAIANASVETAPFLVTGGAATGMAAVITAAVAAFASAFSVVLPRSSVVLPSMIQGS